MTDVRIIEDRYGAGQQAVYLGHALRALQNWESTLWKGDVPEEHRDNFDAEPPRPEPTFYADSEEMNALVCAWLRGPTGPPGATGPQGSPGPASADPNLKRRGW